MPDKKKDPYNGIFDDDDYGADDDHGSAEGADGKKSVDTDYKVEVEKLKEENKKRDELIRQQTEEIERLRKVGEDFSRLQGVFTGKAEEDAEAARRREDARRMEDDPYDTTVEIAKRVNGETTEELKKRLETLESTTHARMVMDRVDKEYIVDWDKDSGKIAKALGLLDPEFRRNNPDAALKQAIRLSNVKVKKRPSVPYSESGGLNEELRQKKAKDAGDRLKERLLSQRDKRQSSVYQQILAGAGGSRSRRG